MKRLRLAGVLTAALLCLLAIVWILPIGIIPRFPACVDAAKIGVEVFGETVVAAQLPRLDCSTSAQPLAMYAFCREIGIEPQWDETPERMAYPRLLPAGMETAPNSRSARARAPSRGERLLWALRRSGLVNTSGTHDAYVNLIDVRNQTRPEPQSTYEKWQHQPADLIFVARPPSEDELKLAERLGVRLDVKPVARDAFVFIVHHTNPIESLTLEQLRAIYSGKTKNWEQLGGPAEPIRAYQRERNSGSQELMQAMVMGEMTMINVGERMVTNSMMGAIHAIDIDTCGIGYTIYYYDCFMAPKTSDHAAKWSAEQAGIQLKEGVPHGRRLLAVEGVTPSAQTIRSSVYPLSTDVYLVMREDESPHSLPRRMRDWLLSDEGQRLVEASSYVPLARSETSNDIR